MLNWLRKNGETIKVDDFTLFQNGSWIPNALRTFISRAHPDLIEEYDQDTKDRIKNQPDYDSLIPKGTEQRESGNSGSPIFVDNF